MLSATGGATRPVKEENRGEVCLLPSLIHNVCTEEMKIEQRTGEV
jgi:hypothetical protein